jgi:hypothetical protein
VSLPFEGEGDVLLTIQLTSGEVAKVSGKRVQLRVVDTYEFVENVPAG